ncbi:MAG: YfcE family phosphodiesterase [Erysipelotrichaceae bacterium]|nr:YfcE family phosphodiesterase [Erysipelotrichaceae bacterium]
MLKLCVASDNHGNMSSIEKILCDNPACDYYFHLGDSMSDPELIAPFISVEGNNDYYYDYPRQRIIELMGHRILMMHGDGYTWSFNTFTDKAKKEKADIVLFGHTHMFHDEMHNGIRFINPGSCYHNRDMTAPCYARVYLLDDGTVKCERINL